VVERARHRIGLDLKSEEGKALCREAVRNADVLIEGFRPGVMERLGLGPDELLGLNPRLVYARMTGWGQDGPLAHAAGHDINYIAITGALAAVGKPGETATPPQNLVGDFGGGSMYCAFGILAALYERERSGKGQVVDAAIVDGATSLMSFFFGVRGRPFVTTERGKGMLGGAAHFYRCFTCADGKEISLGAIEPQFYAELLAKSGAPEELAQGQMNPANWDDYAAKLAALFLTKTQAEWCELLEGSDACFAPVLALDEAREHPHMKARGAYVEHEGEWHTAPAPRFSRTPGAVRSSVDDGAEVVARWAAGS
jgi:alpha-methylacyl-CoA racemase